MKHYILYYKSTHMSVPNQCLRSLIVRFIICRMQGATQLPLVFVDIETTGSSYIYGRVLEVAAIRVENNRVVDEFSTLLNPIGYVPEPITRLTGITSQDVQGQPQFEEIAGRLAAIMNGATFVAHNVRFDYSFIKREFARLEQDFSPKLLCTVRLSRSLFPQYRQHNLQALIERHQLQVSARHRAYEDALALWQFYQLVLHEFDLDTIESALNLQYKRQTLPSHLNESDIQRLPDTPGVYILESDEPTPLYIGKSVNIRQRVLSHFNNDLQKTSELQISQAVRNITTIKTTGELGALLLESRLIKEQQPLHNKRLRSISELTAITETTNATGYFSASLEQGGNIDTTLGLYRTMGVAKRAIVALADEYRLCKKLLGVEKTQGACFGHQLHKCAGACIGQEPVGLYNTRFNQAFQASRIQQWPYDGAILITERHPFVPGATAYLINNWSLVAQIDEDESGEVVIRELNQEFDLDAYKIVSSYLRSPVARRTVKQVNEADVLAFA